VLDNAKTAPPRTREADEDSWLRRPARWWRDGRTFLIEVRNELKRVTWPSSKEVYATTFVVILVSIVFGLYLFGVDYLLNSLVSVIFRRFGAS
jgi:preprotein translocase subunit SecE